MKSIIQSSALIAFSMFFCTIHAKLSILTHPIGKNIGYPGHAAVLRSLLTGLKKNNTDFNLDPRTFEELGDVVYIPGNIEALQQIVSVKKKYGIKKIIAGPNIVMRGFEHNRILAKPEVDYYLQPSSWPAKSLIEDEPALKDKIKIWYAGVDEEYWNPSSEKTTVSTQKNVIVYWKTEPEDFCCKVENLLRSHGYNPIRIKYGQYTAQQYKDRLSQAFLAVFISKTESQGIALAECWSMDVPTFVWDPQETIWAAGKWWWPVSAAPYIQDELGKTWKNLNELEALLQQKEYALKNASPRKWVLENMTDSISAQLILSIIS